jgi:hypothetical protein
MPTYTAFPTDPAAQPKLNGVPYIELEGLEEGNDERGGWARKPYLVDWANRFAFLRGLRGTSALQGAAGTPWIRGLPYQYPDDPTMYCNSVTIQPEGELQLTVPISYPYAKVMVTFRPPTWDPQPAIDDPYFLNQFDPDNPIAYATQEIDFGAEWMTVPRGNLYFISDSSLVGEKVPANKRMTILRMTMTWHELPYLPMGQFQQLADTVNATTFLRCESGTVMCEGLKTTRERSSDGKIVQRVTVSLKWRKHDWNMFLKPDGTWDLVYFGTGGTPDSSKPIYDYRDFRPLLYIGQSA